MVFVTAYDDHAVDAFEAAAADYLLKPIDETRLESCLTRLASRLEQKAGRQSELHNLLQRLAAPQLPGENRLRWLRVGRGDEIELVPVADVVYFRSDHKYTTAVTDTRQHLLRRSLKQLIVEPDPNQFWQIHRGLVVNVADIEKAQRDLRGRYLITLRRRRETLRTSQRFAHRFRQM